VLAIVRNTSYKSCQSDACLVENMVFVGNFVKSS
jgi:hypothetical protein